MTAGKEGIIMGPMVQTERFSHWSKGLSQQVVAPGLRVQGQGLCSSSTDAPPHPGRCRGRVWPVVCWPAGVAPALHPCLSSHLTLLF